MKQILLPLIISFPLVTSTMENPTMPADTLLPAQPLTISAESFIKYMDQACGHANGHCRVQFCTYSLLWAIEEGNDQIFDRALHLWNWYKGHSIEDFTRTELACPFVIAASKGYWYAAEKILARSKGVIVNDSCQAHKKESFDCKAIETSALATAAKNGRAQLVANLLAYESGTAIDPELVHKNKRTPLMEAIEHDKLACTQALLQGKLKKSNPNAVIPDKSFGSVLHWTLSLEDRSQHARALLVHGADKNLIRKEKEYQQEGTPLMVAVAHANMEGVQALLDAKADISIKHPLNKLTALEQARMKLNIASSEPRKKIVELLEKAAINSNITPGA